MALDQFEKALQESTLPEGATAPIKAKFYEALDLIVLNNKRVNSINAAKGQDPTNMEYRDSLWRSNATTDPEITPVEKEFQEVEAKREALLKQLRELAVKHIPEALSEKDAAAAKAAVNESASTISTAVAGASAMVTVIDSMLEIHKKSIPGGVISLLPPVESLKNTRGRKASGNASGTTYMTRVGEIKVDGKSTNKDGKGKFNFAAEELSNQFESGSVPANEVTAEELEEAFFKAMDKPFRSLKSSEIPESFSFDFTKNVGAKKNGTEEIVYSPVTKKITVSRPASKAAEAPATTTPVSDTKATEAAKSETPEKTSAPKTEVPKAVESPTAANVKRPESNKK